jgi:hypothetical protein
MIAALSHVLIHHHTKKVANTEPKQVYGGKQSFVSERTIKTTSSSGANEVARSAYFSDTASTAGKRSRRIGRVISEILRFMSCVQLEDEGA